MRKKRALRRCLFDEIESRARLRTLSSSLFSTSWFRNNELNEAGKLFFFWLGNISDQSPFWISSDLAHPKNRVLIVAMPIHSILIFVHGGNMRERDY
jgi:hypothetical protein